MTTNAAKRHIDREPTHPGAVLREDVLPALQLSVRAPPSCIPPDLACRAVA